MIEFQIKYFKSLDSTNDALKRDYKLLKPFCVYYTTNQTRGRGRLNKLWISEKNKALCFSILFKEFNYNLNISDNLLGISTVSICQLLKTLNIKASIKWPNDIIVNKKKICGILLENSYIGNTIEYLICGIGLNVNQTQKDLQNIDQPATSIYMENDKKLNIEIILNQYLNIMNENLNNSDTFTAFKEYLNYCIPFPDKQIINFENKKYCGRVSSINKDYSLQFLTENGQTLRIHSSDSLSIR